MTWLSLIIADTTTFIRSKCHTRTGPACSIRQPSVSISTSRRCQRNKAIANPYQWEKLSRLPL